MSVLGKAIFVIAILGGFAIWIYGAVTYMRAVSYTHLTLPTIYSV